MHNGGGDSRLSRRSMLKIGSAAVLGVFGGSTLPATASGQTPASPSSKPLNLAPDNADIAATSRAENLFWCDIMMEHASFFAMLMPGPELSVQRGQAETFQRNFQTQYNRLKSATVDRTNYPTVNRSTVELIKPFLEYKRRMFEAQLAGNMRSFVFPLMFDHTAREASHAIQRLEKLTAGNIAFNYSEVIDFWSAASSDESEFIAHFLDPMEQDLISQALDSSAVFRGFNQGNKDRALSRGEIVLAVEDFVDFQTTLEDGINAGRVKGILQPAFADHMRRETLKFVDELKRTVST